MNTILAIKLEELQNEKDDASFLPKMQISGTCTNKFLIACD